MTPDEFKTAVQDIIDGKQPKSDYGGPSTWDDDPESGHADYDDLMETVLHELGYAEGIALAARMCRWYA